MRALFSGSQLTQNVRKQMITIADASHTTRRKKARKMGGFLNVQGKGHLGGGLVGGGYRFGFTSMVSASAANPWATIRLSFALTARRVMSYTRHEPLPANPMKSDIYPKNTIDMASVRMVRARDVHSSR